MKSIRAMMLYCKSSCGTLSTPTADEPDTVSALSSDVMMTGVAWSSTGPTGAPPSLMLSGGFSKPGGAATIGGVGSVGGSSVLGERVCHFL